MRDDDGFSQKDMKRNEDPSQIAGGIGGAAGAGVGAAIGLAALGPVGVVAGVLAGAVGGWWAGKGIQEAVQDVDRSDARFRRAHEHAGATRSYDEVRHGYQLGYLAGRNPENADSDFAQIEPDLRAAWVQAHVRDENPVSWEDVRDEARRGYDLARSGDDRTES